MKQAHAVWFLLFTFLGIANLPFANSRSIDIRKVTFVMTNDIHGGIETRVNRNGQKVGGMDLFSTQVKKLRSQAAQNSENEGVIVVDAGDQFQGTLISNFDEGKTVFSILNEIGYDGVVPGNHDYDFGPIGWLYDRVTPGLTSDRPREVIETLATSVNFPLLSANTYFRNSLRSITTDSPIQTDANCKPIQTEPIGVNFALATRPHFLQPYRIIERAGIRIALIGIDHYATASMTTMENVRDLCFRDEVESYLEVRATLEGQAEIFALVIHGGDTEQKKSASLITEAINRANPNGVHVVAAGHTHQIHHSNVGGVRVVQDGSGGDHFGQLTIFWDVENKKILNALTEAEAGIPVFNETLPSDPPVAKLIQKARNEVGPLASSIVGVATETITRSRIDENALGNLLTDALRVQAKTDISLMNSGGIRANLPKGKITYAEFFEVLPFNNHGVILNAVPWVILKTMLVRSAQTCGRFGALNQSGLKVEFTRNCKLDEDLDADATLVRVTTLAGEVLYDHDQGIEIPPDRTFSIATLDFIAAGGSGYQELQSIPVNQKLGIVRELIFEQLQQHLKPFQNQIDGRWRATQAPK